MHCYPDCGFLQTIQANTATGAQIRVWLFSSMSFPIHYSLVIETEEAVKLNGLE
jgi:hypothetical protein